MKRIFLHTQRQTTKLDKNNIEKAPILSTFDIRMLKRISIETNIYFLLIRLWWLGGRVLDNVDTS